jgi:hypothetical protein
MPMQAGVGLPPVSSNVNLRVAVPRPQDARPKAPQPGASAPRNLGSLLWRPQDARPKALAPRRRVASLMSHIRSAVAGAETKGLRPTVLRTEASSSDASRTLKHPAEGRCWRSAGRPADANGDGMEARLVAPLPRLDKSRPQPVPTPTEAAAYFVPEPSTRASA